MIVLGYILIYIKNNNGTIIHPWKAQALFVKKIIYSCDIDIFNFLIRVGKSWIVKKQSLSSHFTK